MRCGVVGPPSREPWSDVNGKERAPNTFRLKTSSRITWTRWETLSGEKKSLSASEKWCCAPHPRKDPFHPSYEICPKGQTELVTDSFGQE